MKHNFPQVDLPVEMLARRDVTEDILNLYRQSCRLKACILHYALKGHITASINLMEHEIKKNDLIILMPGTILQLNEQVEKVRLCFVGFSSHCVNGINLLQATMGSFSKIMGANPIVKCQRLNSILFRGLLCTTDTYINLPSYRHQYRNGTKCAPQHFAWN